MTDPRLRLSAIYDFSDLRLHPDGTRVYQKATNSAPRVAKVSVQDARSNWIARDAGGTSNINRFRKKSKEIEQKGDEDEDIDLVSGTNEPGGDDEKSFEEDTEASSSKKRKRPKRVDHRKAKRQKFLNGQDFLQSREPPVEEADEEGLLQPEPSPELLKCLHRFASEFYTDRGQLTNSSKEYRQQRKERLVRRREQQEGGKEKRSVSLSSSLTDSGDSLEYGSGSDSEEEDLGGSEDNDPGRRKEKGKEKATVQDEEKPLGKSKRKGRKRAKKLYTDMYKVFDGSALMALGMLVQEQVAYLLEARIPEGWEEEVGNCFTDVNCSEELLTPRDSPGQRESKLGEREDEDEEGDDDAGDQENGGEGTDEGEEGTRSEGGDEGDGDEEEEEESTSADCEAEEEAENLNKSTKATTLNTYPVVHLQLPSNNPLPVNQIAKNTHPDNSPGDLETQSHSDEEAFPNQDNDCGQSLRSSDTEDSEENQGDYDCASSRPHYG